MTNNAAAQKDDRIYYQDQRGTLYGIAVCILPAVPGVHDGFWRYHPVRPDKEIEPLRD